MNDKTFYTLTVSVVLSFIGVALADSYLRSRTAGHEETRFAVQFMKHDQKVRFRGIGDLVKARKAEDEEEKATYYYRAATGMKLAKKVSVQEDILRELARECPGSHKNIQVWLDLIEIKLSAKPPKKPAEEVGNLTLAINKFNAANDEKTVGPVKKLCGSLEKNKFNDLAEKLTETISEPQNTDKK